MDQTPRVLAGRYEVGELIGRGGMAEVYIGRDNRLSRRVAIKVLRSDLAQDSTFQARFRREAQSAAALNHPAIVSVYDTGEDNRVGADGREHHLPFIVMEYVEGHTVRELIRDGAALPIDEAVEITEGVLSALEYSHHAGIVHRDIKPANVMITTAGDVKVMDFGIARAMADSAATMTQTQAVVGTAQYLSPEQARGEVVDARSDVYSTGALLFELLTGRPPFVGDSPVAVAYQHVREDPPTPSSIAPDVPEELDRITLKALAKDRTVRYQSAEEFRGDLQAAQRGGIVGAPAVGVIAAANAVATTPMAQRAGATEVLASGPPPATSPTPPIPEDEDEGRGKAWIWVLAILAVLLTGGILYAVLSGGSGEPAASPTPELPTTVEIPDVTDEPQADAERMLTEAEITFTTQEEPSDDIEAGNATRTDPAAGLAIDPETAQVVLYISTGPSSLVVPDVLGMTEAQAEAALEAARFDPNRLRYEQGNSSDYGQGRVTAIDPGVGSEAAPDTDFTITLATGKTDIPNLDGMNQSQAQEALRTAGLSANFVQTPNGDWEPGSVIDWTPKGETDRLGTITVEIAVEPTETAEPVQPQPSSTSPTPPQNGSPPVEED